MVLALLGEKMADQQRGYCIHMTGAANNIAQGGTINLFGSRWGRVSGECFFGAINVLILQRGLSLNLDLSPFVIQEFCHSTMPITHSHMSNHQHHRYHRAIAVERRQSAYTIFLRLCHTTALPKNEHLPRISIIYPEYRKISTGSGAVYRATL